MHITHYPLWYHVIFIKIFSFTDFVRNSCYKSCCTVLYFLLPTEHKQQFSMELQCLVVGILLSYEFSKSSRATHSVDSFLLFFCQALILLLSHSLSLTLPAAMEISEKWYNKVVQMFEQTKEAIVGFNNSLHIYNILFAICSAGT